MIHELQLIKKLLAAQILRECKSKAEKVDLLTKLGFSTPEVADILGLEPKDVSLCKTVKKRVQGGKDGGNG